MNGLLTVCHEARKGRAVLNSLQYVAFERFSSDCERWGLKIKSSGASASHDLIVLIEVSVIRSTALILYFSRFKGEKVPTAGDFRAALPKGRIHWKSFA